MPRAARRGRDAPARAQDPSRTLSPIVRLLLKNGMPLACQLDISGCKVRRRPSRALGRALLWPRLRGCDRCDRPKRRRSGLGASS